VSSFLQNIRQLNTKLKELNSTKVIVLKANRKIWTNGCNSYRCCNTAWCLSGDCNGYLSYVKQKIASDTAPCVLCPLRSHALSTYSFWGDFFCTDLNTRKITVRKRLFTSHSFGRPPSPRTVSVYLIQGPLYHCSVFAPQVAFMTQNRGWASNRAMLFEILRLGNTSLHRWNAF